MSWLETLQTRSDNYNGAVVPPEMGFAPCQREGVVTTKGWPKKGFCECAEYICDVDGKGKILRMKKKDKQHDLLSYDRPVIDED